MTDRKLVTKYKRRRLTREASALKRDGFMARKKSSFQDVFDLDAEKKRKNASVRKVIPFREYLDLLRQDPSVAQSSSARLHEIVLGQGVETVPEGERWLGVSKRYPMFSKALYGVEKPIADLVEYLGTGAAGLSTGKQPVVFVGPPASGKSSVVTVIKRGISPRTRMEDCLPPWCLVVPTACLVRLATLFASHEGGDFFS